MIRFVFLLGITGSGKSSLVKNMTNILGPMLIVCPDDIRREICGNVNDQSKNNKVFEIAYERTKEFLMKCKEEKLNGMVVFDSTGIYKPGREDILKTAKDLGAHCKIIILKDSFLIDLCHNRICEDIKNGKDRADTRDRSILERQYYGFLEATKDIENEGWSAICKL